MRRNVTNRYGMRRTRHRGRFMAFVAEWWFTLVVCFFMLGLIVILWWYQSRHATSSFADYARRLSIWIVERKNNFHQQFDKVKEMTLTKNEEELPIHFEFYNTLPNMQMKVPVNPLPATAAKPKKPVTISNAEDLERELAQHIERRKKT